MIILICKCLVSGGMIVLGWKGSQSLVLPLEMASLPLRQEDDAD